jgi:ribosomal protein L21E
MMLVAAPALLAQPFPDDYRHGRGNGGWGDGRDGYGSLRILRAEYGYGNRYSDVTRVVRNFNNGDQLQLRVVNETFGFDPWRGKDKDLRVLYEYRGQRMEARAQEGDVLYLPQGWGRGRGDRDWGSSRRNAGLYIVSARYGDGGRYVDVTRYLQNYVRGDSLRMRVENHALGGDPYRGKDKQLYVVYEYRGQRFETRVREYDELILPNFNDRSARFGGY